MTSNISSSDESDLNHQDFVPEYPESILMKYGGFERVRKIAATLQELISQSKLLAPFFEHVDTKEHIKQQEQYLRV